MKRSYIYIIVILLTISLVSADYIIGRDLKKIIPLDETYRTVADDSDLVKEATVYTTLTIKNEQNTDEAITYKYKIKFKDFSGAVKYKYNNKENYLVITANGEGNFELKNNESITLYDLPLDLEYTLTQMTTDSKYIIKVNQVEQNVYSGQTAEGAVVVFNNSTRSDNKTPAKDTNKDNNQDKKEEPKKEDNKPSKKDIPNTGESEIKMVVILLLSLLVIYCIRKIKVKRFE